MVGIEFIIVLGFIANCLHKDQIEDIYFFQVNTKYISSSAVKKIARVKMLIFSPHEMKYILYLP